MVMSEHFHQHRIVLQIVDESGCDFDMDLERMEKEGGV